MTSVTNLYAQYQRDQRTMSSPLKITELAQWIIIDLDEPRKPIRESINVDAVIVHPSKRIIACQNRSTLEIFDIEDEIKLKEHKLESRVLFWKWINDVTIDFVTETAVYSWELSGSAAPRMIFKKHDSLSGMSIFDYSVDADRGWHAIVGGKMPTQTTSNGIIQLFNSNGGATHVINGYAACMCNYKLVTKSVPTNYVIYATKKVKNGKLRFKDLSSIGSMGINNPFSKEDESFSFEFTLDYPIFVKATPNYGVIYLATKYGFIHIFDLESRVRLYSFTISQFSMTAVAGSTTKGLVGINTKGQVLSVSITEQSMLKHVEKMNPKLASKLAKRWAEVPEHEANANALPQKIPLSSVSGPSLPALPSAPSLPMNDAGRLPIYLVTPISDRIPPSQIHLYAQPPPCSPRDPVERTVAPTDSEIRAKIAEMERDVLAARVAELELKYRAAITQKEQEKRQGGEPNLLEEKQNGLRF